MHFILIAKKQDFEYDQINEDLLSKASAPSLIARESVKFEINNFILYIYPYDQVDEEIYNYSYYMDDNQLLLINGLVNINKKINKLDITEFFNQLNDSEDLLGDYQIISIDKKGNGIFKTPPLSIRQLFFYENDNCAVFSTEIKLIVDGIKKNSEKSFINNFDVDFIEDALFREWKTRFTPQKTIFKNIQRIFPHDIKYFKEGEIVIERKNSIEIPNWFRSLYNEDKEKLYDEYYKTLVRFAETSLINLHKIKKITLGLTGGLDSRLTASILSKICKKHKIQLEFNTFGQEDHPDVVIAKRIATVLKIKHIHSVPQNNKAKNTTQYTDYITTFYASQGDFNSKNNVANYNRKMSNLTILPQSGMDAFKRVNMDQIYSANRWYARIILSVKNFFFPLFFTTYEVWFAMLYKEIGENNYYEFVYEILKRSEPELLNIPFAGDQLPQTDIKPYLTTAESKFHKKEPFLWDYELVKMNMKPLFEKRFNKLNKKSRLILDLVDLNEFDYFYDEKLREQIELFEKNQIDSKTFQKYIINQKLSENYPKSKIMLELTKENLYNPYINRLQILMDFATVANYYSFQELEKDIF